MKNGVEAVATTKKSAQGHADKSNGHAKRAKKFMSSAQKAAKEAKKALKKAQALGASSSTPVTFLADNILFSSLYSLYTPQAHLKWALEQKVILVLLFFGIFLL